MEGLIPFKTDGCSGGMSWLWVHVFHRPTPWEDKCEKHDYAYWMGGTAMQRKRADIALAAGVAKAGYPLVGALMYYAVRVGGVPWLPTSYRWGYGHGRKFGGYNE